MGIRGHLFALFLVIITILVSKEGSANPYNIVNSSVVKPQILVYQPIYSASGCEQKLTNSGYSFSGLAVSDGKRQFREYGTYDFAMINRPGHRSYIKSYFGGRIHRQQSTQVALPEWKIWRPYNESNALIDETAEDSPIQSFFADLFAFWQEKGLNPDAIEQIHSLQTRLEPGRSFYASIGTHANNHLAGIRIYEGSRILKVLDFENQIHAIDTSKAAALPMQIRFPNIDLGVSSSGVYYEIGLLTSRVELGNSITTLLAQAADYLLKRHGQSNIEYSEIIEFQPLPRTKSHVDGFNVFQPELAHEAVLSPIPTQVPILVTNYDKSLETLEDLDIMLFAVATHKLSRQYESLFGFTILSSVSNEINLLSISAVDFIKRFHPAYNKDVNWPYFSNKASALPEFNEELARQQQREQNRQQVRRRYWDPNVDETVIFEDTTKWGSQ